MQRYIYFGIALVLGLIAGLYYGWVVSPVVVAESGSEHLRADYQADYALMAAEIYQSEQNPEQAIEDLELLVFENPLQAIEAAIRFGEENAYSEKDLDLLRELDAAMREWDPRLAETAAP